MVGKVKATFPNILIDIAKEDYIKYPTDVKGMEQLLERLKIYYDDYGRHLYSDISLCLYEMNPQDIDYLVPNLIELVKYSEDDDLNDKLFKLIDHIKLEIQRSYKMSKDIKVASVEVFKKSYEKFKEEYDDIKAYTDKNIETAESKLEDLEESIKKINIESITILGIFSGMVMAFFGGFGFLSEVLKNMHQVSKYRLTFITLIIGFIFFNTFFLLIYYIGKIVDKPIRNKCLSNNCSCTKECCSIEKVRKLYPIIYYINIFLIIMIVAVTSIWYLSK